MLLPYATLCEFCDRKQIMWPTEPDEFEANHLMPDDADHGDAWYFVFTRGELVCKSNQGGPEPITADDFRWMEMAARGCISTFTTQN